MEAERWDLVQVGHQRQTFGQPARLLAPLASREAQSAAESSSVIYLPGSSLMWGGRTAANPGNDRPVPAVGRSDRRREVCPLTRRERAIAEVAALPPPVSH